MVDPFYNDVRLKLVMAGERAGKSFMGGTYGAARFMHHYLQTPDKPYLLWLVGKDYEACKPEFDNLTEQLVRLGMISVRDIYVRDGGRDKCSASTTDGMLYTETVTGADPQKIARLAPNGILACEVAQFSEELFLRCIGRLAEKRGWLWASGSWEGSLGYLPTIWRRWQAENPDDGCSWAVPSWSNHHLYPGGATDPEIERMRALFPPGRFRERFGGEPASPSGAVYADDLTPERITFDARFDPDAPVQVWIDPGYSGAYAVLAVQLRAGFVDIIDEVYRRERTNDQVIDECRKRPWWSRVTYGVIDRAGQQHHAEQSAVEAWNKAGVRLSWRKVPIIDGIDRVKTFLRGSPGLPYLRINPACAGLIAEMGHGPMPYPDMRPYSYHNDASGSVVRDIPDMKNNHSCSALAYGLVDNFGWVGDKTKDSYVGTYFSPRGPSYLDWGRRAPTLEEVAQRMSGATLRDAIARSM